LFQLTALKPEHFKCRLFLQFSTGYLVQQTTGENTGNFIPLYSGQCQLSPADRASSCIRGFPYSGIADTIQWLVVFSPLTHIADPIAVLRGQQSILFGFVPA
jgi:hypothetical protein